ncbi:histidine phosphatase family protein [Ureibacillus sinduriensis]|uniref:Phosphoglycerate mutase n=1 Tax=Ureibacillus sinduriensis BLB-1 = JCM 15800 TaxID=1384057 RepID=A0A0A3IN37_9BACL|nr:histidine phosphatase family protein [Ureibacillus sinduriensis]KGR76247.1 phosphoglycerate mutase [Ureibacillus sinduriensis BLB-1 = JCM 15800]
MLTNVYFVRHAHSTYTPDEVGRPLSVKGLADAERISEVLAKENIDIIIASPYKRAIQSVEPLGVKLEKEVILEAGFKERTLSLEPVENFTQAITRVWENPAFSLPGGESNHVAQNCGIMAIGNVLESYEGKNIAIGTHGNIMVLIMNHFDKKFDFNFWKNLDMPDIYKLTFENKNLLDVKRIWDSTR